MPAPEGVSLVPNMYPDPRIKVYRRLLTSLDDFENLEVDAYVILTERYAVILDTLVCPQDMQALLDLSGDELNERDLLVVNSHADWDHCWGNAYFTGKRAVPIIGHEYEVVRMESDEARADLDEYQQKYPLFRDVALVSPTITFHDHLTINGGDLTIRLFAAPGHHPDHCAAWIPELRLLLAFDAIEKPLPIIEDAASAPVMFATLERFLELQPQRILCSHGNVTDPGLIQQNLDYLREIERRCQAFLQTRRPKSEELAHAAELIGYSFDEVIAGSTEPIDRAFYSWAHENNVQAILGWLLQ